MNQGQKRIFLKADGRIFGPPDNVLLAGQGLGHAVETIALDEDEFCSSSLHSTKKSSPSGDAGFGRWAVV